MDKIHHIVFQHAPEEPMGYFETICRQWKIPFDYIRLFETNEVSKVHATHVLIMGGPISANDETYCPYLAKEKKSIRSFVKSGYSWIRHLPLAKRDEISHDRDVFLTNIIHGAGQLLNGFLRKNLERTR